MASSAVPSSWGGRIGLKLAIRGGHCVLNGGTDSTLVVRSSGINCTDLLGSSVTGDAHQSITCLVYPHDPKTFIRPIREQPLEAFTTEKPVGPQRD